MPTRRAKMASTDDFLLLLGSLFSESAMAQLSGLSDDMDCDSDLSSDDGDDESDDSSDEDGDISARLSEFRHRHRFSASRV